MLARLRHMSRTCACRRPFGSAGWRSRGSDGCDTVNTGENFARSSYAVNWLMGFRRGNARADADGVTLTDTTSGGTSAVGLPTPPASALARPGSRAVVVGTGMHVPGSALLAISAVAATVAAVGDALTDQCVMDPRHVVAVTDPEGPSRFLEVVNQAAEQAEDVLLLYYIGHGLVDLAGELFLATSATTGRDIMLPVEALSFAAIRSVLAAHRARHVVVVLDCCFSGRAHGAFGTAVADSFELTKVQGSYLLSATSATEQALARPGEPYTAFSGALLELLRDGDPAAPRGLTLDDAYRHLVRALPRRGAPAPQRRLSGDAGRLVVAVNPRAPEVIRPRADYPGRLEPAPSASRPCPYPGLEAFTADDTDYFYGRERLVDEVLRVLAADGPGGPLAIVGRSGAGKSSLLQAGLLPAIRAGRLDVPGSRHWPQLVMTPGGHPLRVLAGRLAAGTGQDGDTTAAILAADPGELQRIIAAGPRGDHAPGGLILCVDQFEEVFTACTDEAERRAFIQALCPAPAGGGTPGIRVILGLRADFYNRCLDYPELAPMVRAGQVPVRPMSREELRSAIERPAEAAGLRLEEGLPGRLLLDLESVEGPDRDPDSALPLLAFALQATWQCSDKRELTLSDYQATGGIWGAVTQRADGVYDDLAAGGRESAKLLLLSMVQLGDGTDDVRRRVSVDDLLAGRPAAEQAAIRGALDAYVAARLVTVDNDTAEIAHEALLRAWPRLRQWIEDDRKDLLDRQRLAEAARVWKSAAGPLYAGARLDEARKWLGQEQPRARRLLSPVEEGFVRASVRAVRRRKTRRWSFVAVAAVAVLLLVAGGVYAIQQRAGNQQSQAVESSIALAQDAGILRTTDPAGAMWLSLAAYNSSRTSQARTQLYDSLTTPYPLTLPGHVKGPVADVAYSPGGATAAAVWKDGTVLVWRVTDPLRPVLFATLHVRTGGVDRLEFSPDGRLLAVHALDSLELWKVGDGSGHPVLMSDTTVTVPWQLGEGAWLPVAFSPDGRIVATGDGDGRLRLWNVTDPAHPALMTSIAVSSRPLSAVAFSPDGDALAAASDNTTAPDSGRVRLWDMRDPARPTLRTTLAVGSALSVAFSSVGNLLAAAGSNEKAYVWHVADIRKPVSAQVDTDDNGGALSSVAFCPHSDVFVMAYSGGETGVWSSVEQLWSEGGDLPDPAGPDSVAFSPSGSQILTGDSGGSVELWIAPEPLLTGPVYTDSGGSLWNGNSTLTVTDNNYPEGAASPVELWNVSDPFHPIQDASLPGNWTYGYFLPDSDTIVTTTADGNVMRLWNVSDPRHPRAGAELSDLGYSSGSITSASWAGSDNGLMLIANTDDVRLWDVSNISHPVLDGTLNVTSTGSVAFLSDRLAAVVEQNGIKLWDIGNPRHPVAEGVVPVMYADVGGIYIPSRQLMAADNVMTDRGTASGTTLWSLRDLRKPGDLAPGVDMDPTGIAGLNNDIWVALTTNDDALDVWDTRNPRLPTRIAALPVENASASSLSAVNSPGGWLVATGSNGNNGDYEVYVSEVPSNGRAISSYAQIPGDVPDYQMSPDGKLLTTNLETTNDPESALTAFDPQAAATGSPGIVYPLNSDSLYQHLCSIVSQAPFNPSWQQYLPDTYYRPACS